MQRYDTLYDEVFARFSLGTPGPEKREPQRH